MSGAGKGFPGWPWVSAALTLALPAPIWGGSKLETRGGPGAPSPLRCEAHLGAARGSSSHSLPGSGLLRSLETLRSPRLHQLSKPGLHAETGAASCFLPPAPAPHRHRPLCAELVGGRAGQGLLEGAEPPRKPEPPSCSSLGRTRRAAPPGLWEPRAALAGKLGVIKGKT